MSLLQRGYSENSRSHFESMEPYGIVGQIFELYQCIYALLPSTARLQSAYYLSALQISDILLV